MKNKNAMLELPEYPVVAYISTSDKSMDVCINVLFIPDNKKQRDEQIDELSWIYEQIRAWIFDFTSLDI